MNVTKARKEALKSMQERNQRENINFSRIARQLNEENPALSVERASGERALEGGQKQIDKTNQRKDRQKAQMATQKSTPTKSDVSYASEEARQQREYDKMWHNEKSDWRTELVEAAKPDEQGNHPYVDVMPFVNQKQREAKNQEKAAIKGGAQAKMAEAKELSIDDQMRISREAAKSRNPNPDHKAIRGRMLAKAPKTKDTRTDAEKMADATGPRPGSRYRGD